MLEKETGFSIDQIKLVVDDLCKEFKISVRMHCPDNLSPTEFTAFVLSVAASFLASNLDNLERMHEGNLDVFKTLEMLFEKIKYMLKPN